MSRVSSTLHFGANLGFLVLVFALSISSALASTRVPTPGTYEMSLYYWRSLCRDQPQIETPAQRELSCPTQHWRVRTLPGDDRVTEVMDDAS